MSTEVIKMEGKQLDASSIYMQSVFDKIYPVGSIYMSVNSTSPASLFGGTWTQLKDRFLVGAGNSYSVNSTGGEATHKLTANEMPSHTHSWSIPVGGYSGWSTKSFKSYVLKWSDTTMYNTDAGTSTIHYANVSMNGGNGYTGGNQAHNNTPPIWLCICGNVPHKKNRRYL